MDRVFFNKPQLKQRRRQLRNNMTKEEHLLWYRIRSSQLGYKFTRQYSVGGYVVDFYCYKKRLALEIDGGQHNDGERIEYDDERTKYIESFNIKVIRFWNSEVLNNLNDVLEQISREIENRIL